MPFESSHALAYLNNYNLKTHQGSDGSVSGKAVPVYGIKTYRGSRGMAPLTFNRETRLRVVSFTPRPLYPRAENPAPTYGGGEVWLAGQDGSGKRKMSRPGTERGAATGTSIGNKNRLLHELSDSCDRHCTH